LMEIGRPGRGRFRPIHRKNQSLVSSWLSAQHQAPVTCGDEGFVIIAGIWEKMVT
jgi:hypothetical protein